MKDVFKFMEEKSMSTTQPIRSKRLLEQFKEYYQEENPNIRNYTLIILGLNTALRISDILSLRWGDSYDEKKGKLKEHIEVFEKKTGKSKIIALNTSTCNALYEYKNYVFSHVPYNAKQYLFLSQKGDNIPICRSQAYRIIKQAANATGLYEHISCHSLRKTFGYHAWKQGIPPALLMDIYNHSSYKITKRYLCIEQDERDEVYKNISL